MHVRGVTAKDMARALVKLYLNLGFTFWNSSILPGTGFYVL